LYSDKIVKECFQKVSKQVVHIVYSEQVCDSVA
jgi:hypothetical protein